MAIPTELGVSFTPAEVDSMKAAAKTITDLIRSKKAINLTNDERKNLSTVSDDRAPYVLKSLSEYAVSFPKLNGLAYSHKMAAEDMKTYGELFEVLTSLSEATEVATEMQMVAGHFSYKFMTDQYYNAKRYLGDNVEGAQVVYDGLKGCFEGQGPQVGDDDSPADPDTTDTPPA
jgi:hypothetical protein